MYVLIRYVYCGPWCTFWFQYVSRGSWCMLWLVKHLLVPSCTFGSIMYVNGLSCVFWLVMFVWGLSCSCLSQLLTFLRTQFPHREEPRHVILARRSFCMSIKPVLTQRGTHTGFAEESMGKQLYDILPRIKIPCVGALPKSCPWGMHDSHVQHTFSTKSDLLFVQTSRIRSLWCACHPNSSTVVRMSRFFMWAHLYEQILAVRKSPSFLADTCVNVPKHPWRHARAIGPCQRHAVLYKV